jgi:hypothetical protein
MATPTVEITAPAPSIKELEQAMIAAHNAGDENSASILANEINKLQSTSKFQFSATETAKNLGPSIVKEAKNLVGAITQPLETAKSLGNLSLGVIEKAIPGKTYPHEKYANAMGDYFANRYGSKDAFLSELQNNPASVLSDLSTIVTGGATTAAKVASLSKVGAKAVPTLEKVAQVGTAIDPLNLAANTATYGVTKAIPNTIAPMMYESAAKWSTKLGPEERAAITETALKNQIPLNYEGLGKVQSKLGQLGDKMDNLIANATDQNIKIPATKVLESLKDVKKASGGFKIEAAQDIKEINDIEQRFKTYLKQNKITSVTPQQLQDFKSDAYKRIDFGRSPEKPSIAKEQAYRSMAESARTSLEGFMPELRDINAQYGALKELQPNLQKAVGRIENRDILGLGTGVKTGTGAAVGGIPGALVGFGQSLLEAPTVKSKAALNLYKKQQQGLGMFLDNNARNALARQLIEKQFEINSQYPGLLSQ